MAIAVSTLTLYLAMELTSEGSGEKTTHLCGIYLLTLIFDTFII